ncbi:MAG: DNA cytosine methyltransferase, partial [Candidatus Marinimicrobia bacterium]|nr:DNA cytosine methyltransferase [Candidatus Neomarinimicrobiota bacterium]
IEDNPVGVEWNDPAETTRLLEMMTEKNLAKIRNAQKLEGTSIGFLYRRTRKGAQRAEVRFDGVAGCLRTPEGGSSRQTVLLVEKGLVRSRLLSPRETSRLMGVPDTFLLPKRYNDSYRAMGDGVAVPVVRWLSSHLLIPFVAAARNRLTNHSLIADRASGEQLQEFRNGSDVRVQNWETSNA